MASGCLRALSRTSLFSLRPHISKANTAARRPPPTNSTAASADVGSSPIRRIRVFSRAPVELGSCGGSSMYPLHSAVAAARLTSRLSLTSRCCRDLSQVMIEASSSVSFDSADMFPITKDYDDTIVVTAMINSFDVHRVLVNTGSPVNIIFYNAAGITSRLLVLLWVSLVKEGSWWERSFCQQCLGETKKILSLIRPISLFSRLILLITAYLGYLYLTNLGLSFQPYDGHNINSIRISKNQGGSDTVAVLFLKFSSV